MAENLVGIFLDTITERSLLAQSAMTEPGVLWLLAQWMVAEPPDGNNSSEIDDDDAAMNGECAVALQFVSFLTGISLCYVCVYVLVRD